MADCGMKTLLFSSPLLHQHPTSRQNENTKITLSKSGGTEATCQGYVRAITLFCPKPPKLCSVRDEFNELKRQKQLQLMRFSRS